MQTKRQIWANRPSVIEKLALLQQLQTITPYGMFHRASKGGKGKKAMTKRIPKGITRNLPNVSKNDITERIAIGNMREKARKARLGC